MLLSSMPYPVAQKLSSSMKSQPCTHNNSGYAASTSSIVETHRRHQVEQLRKKSGEYGKPVRIGEYKEFKMIFDWLPCYVLAVCEHCSLVQPPGPHSGGCDWWRLFMTNITDVQKKVTGKPLGDGQGQEVGSMVLPGTLWTSPCTGQGWRR